MANNPNDMLYPLHIERKTDTIESLAAELIAEVGFDPLGLYCTHTGQLLGRLNREAITALATIIPYDIDNPATWDDIKSELLTRCYASMRPGPAWGFVNNTNVGELMAYDLYGSLTYLLFRLWEPLISREYNLARGQHVWRSFESKAEWLHNKIVLRARLETWPRERVKELVSKLVEADGWVGLHKIPLSNRFTVDTIIVEWSTDVDQLIDEIIPILTEYVNRAMLTRERTGNTRSARAISYFHERPISSAMIKARKKEAETNLIANLFKAWDTNNEYADEAAERLELNKSVKPKTTVIPVGQKFTFKVKSSNG